MAKEHFQRSLPHINLGFLGAESDRNALVTAILTTLNARGICSVSTSAKEFNTQNRHYSIVNDGISRVDYIKNMIIGAAQMDGAILVVQVQNAVSSQVREYMLFAQQIGLKKIIVFINNADQVDDREILNLLERELREQLSSYGFDGDDTPIICGSAQRAINGESTYQDKIIELLNACDNYLPIPASNVDKPFLLPIEDIFTITGRGTVATGRIERGVIHLADTVERVGLSDTTATYVVTGIEMFRKSVDQAQAGDNVGILLRGADRNDLNRGMVLAAPGSIKAYTDFNADIYILTKAEGGRSAPITNGYRPQFYFRTTDVTGTMQFPNGVTMITPGSSASVTVQLITPIALEKDQRFAIREGGRTVGMGVVTRLLPRKPKTSKPFLIPISEIVATVTGRGTIVSGQVERGTLNLLDMSECIGFGKTANYAVTSISVSNKDSESAKEGDNVSILLRGAGKDDVVKGMVVATPGTVKEGKEFDADITIPGKDEGGRHNPFKDQMRIQNPGFQIRTAVVSGTFQILGNMVSPNVPFPIHVKLAQSVALEVGLQVKLRNDTKVVATGVITKIGS